MHLFLQVVKGDLFEIDVDPSISIQDLKGKVQSEFKLRDGVYRFVHNGTILENTLEGINEYETVLLVIRDVPKREASFVGRMAAQTLAVVRSNGVYAAYNPEYHFSRNPERCRQFGELVRQQAPRIVARRLATAAYTMPLRYAGASVGFCFGMCGGYIHEPAASIDEVTVGIDTMSTAQKQAFDRLLALGTGRDTTYQVFAECGFDEAVARERLSASREQ